MTEFKEIEFPAEVKKRLLKAGGVPLTAMAAESGDRSVFLILSDDPMTGTGSVAFERHLSVSAKVNGRESRPTFGEIFRAVQATELDVDKAEFFSHSTSSVVHLFAKK